MSISPIYQAKGTDCPVQAAIRKFGRKTTQKEESMSDFISREAVLMAVGEHCGWIPRESVIDSVIIGTQQAIHNKISSIPAADVAPVVRCKDCRFYASKQSSLCDMHNTAVNAEDYCSYGTKMD